MVKQHDVIDSLAVASGLGGSQYTSELEKGRRQEIGSNHLAYKLMTNCQINQMIFARINVTYLWNALYEMYLVVLRVPWTARRSNQSILKEINPEYSLEGLMLKLKLQYSGHLMQRVDSLEKTLMLGKMEGRKRESDRG